MGLTLGVLVDRGPGLATPPGSWSPPTSPSAAAPSHDTSTIRKRVSETAHRPVPAVQSYLPTGGISRRTGSMGMVAGKVTINGRSRSIAIVPLHTTALDFLRGCGLVGCKEGCAEGECGACSVLVARPGLTTPTEWVAINACLVPVAAPTARRSSPPRGLAPRRAAPRPAGDGRARRVAVRLLHARLRLQHGGRVLPAGPARPADGEQDGADHEHGPNGFDLHALSGNLCRCTGYRPIRDAAYALGDPDGTIRRPPLRGAATAACRHPAGPRRRRVRSPAATSPRPSPCSASARRHARRGLDRLGRRGQPLRRPRPVGRRHRPAPELRAFPRRRRRDRDRGGPDPDRGRAPLDGRVRCWRS